MVWGAVRTALLLGGFALLLPGYEAMMTRIAAHAGRPADIAQSLDVF